MRSEIVPFETTREKWAEAHRLADVKTAPDEQRAVVELACQPALVYEVADQGPDSSATPDWPERLSIYHGHIRLQMSVQEWEWLKERGDAVIRLGKVANEAYPEDFSPRRLA